MKGKKGICLILCIWLLTGLAPLRAFAAPGECVDGVWSSITLTGGANKVIFSADSGIENQILHPDGLTAGQYIDFQTYTKAGHEDHIVEILSVVLVPKGHRYGDGYEFADVQAAIRQHLCVSDALAVLAFFFVALKDLIGSSLTYSRTLAKRLKGKAAKEMLERIAAAEATLSTTAGAGPRR